MIAMEFARFLGLPLSRRANITDIADAVCGVSLDARVTLVASTSSTTSTSPPAPAPKPPTP